MSKKLTQKEFEQRLKVENKAYSLGLLEIIGAYESMGRKIRVRDKYGECLVITDSLLRGFSPTIKTAINKTSYFINKAKEVHGDLYDYSKAEYKSARDRVNIVCKKHGVFKIVPFQHLQGVKCQRCSRQSTTESIRKAPQGWSWKIWRDKAYKSKEFDCYKVYIIKCWNKEEEFYKVGRTFTEVEYRFYRNAFPYNYKIIQLFCSNDPKEIYDMEIKLKRKNKVYKYIPKQNFSGMHECFSEIISDENKNK